MKIWETDNSSRTSDCRTANLQVETTSESSMTGGPAAKAVAVRTKVEVVDGGEVEVDGVEVGRVESQTAKFKFMIFC